MLNLIEELHVHAAYTDNGGKKRLPMYDSKNQFTVCHEVCHDVTITGQIWSFMDHYHN